MGQVNLAELTDNSLVAVQDIRDLKTFRVTGLVSFQECPKRWMTEMLGLSDLDAETEGKTRKDRSKYANIGTAAHNVIELFLSDRWVHTESVEWAMAHCMKAGMPPLERENLIGYLSRLGRDEWKRRAVVTELKLEGSPVAGLLSVGGTLDYVGFHEVDGCWDILDHKTNRQVEGAEEWAAKIQPRFYAWLLRQYLREQGEVDKPIRYTIGYVNCHTMVQWITDPTEDAEVVILYASLVRQYLVYCETGEWPERLNPWCYGCPLMATCRTAQGAMMDLAALGGEMEEKNVSLLQQHDFYSNVSKLAGEMLNEVRDSIKDRMTEEEAASWQEEGVKATLRRDSRRRVDFWKLWDTIRAPGAVVLDEDSEREFGNLFSVRLGALDAYVSAHPELALSVVGIIETEENEEPTLTVRRSGKKAGK